MLMKTCRNIKLGGTNQGERAITWSIFIRFVKAISELALREGNLFDVPTMIFGAPLLLFTLVLLS
jgi:hypothetical protein